LANAGLDRLWRAEPPWIATYSAMPKDAYELAWNLQQTGAVARALRGPKMTTLGGFYAEVGAALQFPDYFGENWAAFDECLTDLAWLRGPAIVLLVTVANLLFRVEGFDSLPTLFKIAQSAGKAWATAADQDKPWGHGSVPFHLLLQVRGDAFDQWNRRLARFGLEVPALDLEAAG
jgi:hypothetical protein